MNCLVCGAVISGGATACPRCGASLGPGGGQAVSPTLPLGTRLANGKYTVEKVLGAGGFGITYLGTDVVLSRPVAIKELFPGGCQRNGTTLVPTRLSPSDFSSMKQRFLKEARLLARLNHPGVVKVYDFFEENGTAYMVMEYLRGRSLARILQERGGRLEEGSAVSYIERVGEALEVVHQAGILHRDIKPENIIVTEDGRVVLIDFGAAREYVAGKTGRQTVVLTPGFAPPEQYAQFAERGAYTDVYALAATLYYLLTGEVPVSATDRAAGVELASVREKNPGVSKVVSEAVMAGMAMEVRKRPQSVRAFLDRLRGRVGIGVAAAPSVSVSLSKVVLVKTLDTGPVHSLSFSPDGSLLASGNDDTTVKLWRVADGQLIATLKGHTKPVLSVSFSPDGSWLASGSGDGTVKLWRVADGKLLRTLKGHTRWVSSVSFSPDGSWLASGSWDDTVKLWRVER